MTRSLYDVVFFILINSVYGFQTEWIHNSATDISDEFTDEFLDSYQLINKYGYKAEKHSVITEDGYFVTLIRLVGRGPPVLLGHGITDSSDAWLVLGPNDSLAFLLAANGYDVWLYNARGNKYSKNHVDDTSRKQFWDFSFEEMGTRDLVASIDHILSTTSQATLSYIGFSQGTTIFLVMCSLKPEYNSKINFAILLAPVAWTHKIKYPFIKFFTDNLDTLITLADSVGLQEIFPWNPVNNEYHALACRKGRASRKLCDIEYFISFGIKNSSSISPEKFPIVASHVPAGTSAKTFVHFMQNYRLKRFARFEHGKRINQMLYGRSEPPDYNVSLVTVPVVLIASEVDWFSTIENVQTLRKVLPNVVRYIIFNESLEFTHLEFVFGARAKSMVNDLVINILKDS